MPAPGQAAVTAAGSLRPGAAHASALLRLIRPVEEPAARVVCFPYAGAGVSVYAAWARLAPEDMEIWAVQLPGREDRVLEPAVTEPEALLQDLLAAVGPLAGIRTCLFGHSLGGLVAFSLAGALERQGMPCGHLAVSARRGPCSITPHLGLAELGDGELVTRLRRLGGLPEAILDRPDMLELVLPAIRGDLRLSGRLEAAVAARPAAISCPITALAGLADDAVPARLVREWSEHTHRRFRLHHMDGDHFFVRRHGRNILAIVERELRKGW